MYDFEVFTNYGEIINQPDRILRVVVSNIVHEIEIRVDT